MLKTILVPLDGSELSERALAYAQVLAQQAHARIVLVRAVMAGYSHHGREGAQKEMHDANEELVRVAARLEQNGINATRLLLNDEPAWGVVTAAQEEHADLIIMSTHGRSGFGRWVYGSVAEHVLHDSRVPILLVPGGATFNWPADPGALRIVVPLDGSPVAEEALGIAADMAEASGGEVILVQAFPAPILVPEQPDLYEAYDPVEAAEAARRHLAPITARLAERGVRSEIYTGEGRPEEVILDAVRDRHAHLIAMATHGRTGLSHLLMGGVADAVVRRTHVAVLLARSLEAQAPARERPAAGTRQPDEPALEASPEEAPLAILMSPLEIEVTTRALEQLVAGAEAETLATGAARELLMRLTRAQEPSNASEGRVWLSR
jgi:nucleotide-binding universal stress UspA family protein